MFNSTSFTLRFIAAFCVPLGLSTAAFAAPPETPDNSEVLAEKLEDKLADHQGDIARSTASLKRKMERTKSSAEGDLTENLDVMADMMEEVFAKDGLFRDLTALFADIAEDIDVDTDDGQTVLRFDGTEVGKIEHGKSRDSEDMISISGLGKSLTLDRQTIIKDGKSKTRIVIEMDGADEIDITLPDLD
jgi:hypothetical protein